MNKYWSYTFIATILLFSSCVEEKVYKDNLVDAEWKLFKYTDILNGPSNIVAEENEEYTILFNSDGGIEAMDACNSCVGSFLTIDGDSIIFEEVSCTEMACNGGSWMSNLNGSYIYIITDDTLVITKIYNYDVNPHSYYFSNK